MNADFEQQLLDAIASLKVEPNYIDILVFPVCVVIVSSILGWLVAMWTMRYQDRINANLAKRDAANLWILGLEGVLEHLIAIKLNYQGKLTSDPFQRAAVIPSILSIAHPIDLDISLLAFIKPEADSEWSQITRVRGLHDNYNLMVSQWERRNEIERPIRTKVIADVSGDAYAYVTREQFIKSVGSAKTLELIDLTEQLVKSTDQLIREFVSFLHNFPEIAKRNVDVDLLQHHGGIVVFQPHESWNAIAEYEPKPDYKIISELCDLPLETIIGRYGTGYDE